jgi:hypothetical protein
LRGISFTRAESLSTGAANVSLGADNLSTGAAHLSARFAQVSELSAKISRLFAGNFGESSKLRKYDVGNINRFAGNVKFF